MKAAATLRAALAALGCAAAVVPAHALSLVSATANAQVLNAAVVNGSAIQADVGFRSAGTVSMVFELGAADVGGMVSFNSVVSLLDGAELSLLSVTLDGGADFAYVGSVTPGFGRVATQGGTNRAQFISFAPPETYRVDLGDPFAQPGTQDWLISFDTLGAGDRFALSISAVPEAGAGWLVMLGLPMVGWAVRRRQQRGRQAAQPGTQCPSTSFSFGANCAL